MYERHDSRDSPLAVMVHIMDLSESEFIRRYCLSKALASIGALAISNDVSDQGERLKLADHGPTRSLLHRPRAY
jgi:hypothetical protein